MIRLRSQCLKKIKTMKRMSMGKTMKKMVMSMGKRMKKMEISMGKRMKKNRPIWKMMEFLMRKGTKRKLAKNKLAIWKKMALRKMMRFLVLKELS
ncbi:hypothetical protein Bca52824_057990 [Brassica carinata]|uniref:Uncharacterized protein n=1 Tax=Brassica carinata TaxID=52824 RepID=A0A8X7QRM4_BRACI|nr:hypothetical protein Bca52824_057990 [Brassica carinata]